MGRHHERAAVRWHHAAPRRAALAVLAVASVAAALHCSPFDFDSADDGGGDGGATDRSTLDAAPGGEARRPVPNGNYVIYVSNETLNGAEASGYRCEPPPGDAGPEVVRYVPLLRTLSLPSLDYFIDAKSTYSRSDGAVLGTGEELLSPRTKLQPIFDRLGQRVSTEVGGGTWTGFQVGVDGTFGGASNCDEWRSDAKAERGWTGGWASDAAGGWLSWRDSPCDQRRHVYCVQIE